jgi:hypothetical protein
MRTPRGLFGPGRAFTKPCRPLTFPSSPVGTPESESCIRPMCCPSSRSSRMVMRSCTYESEDFCFALPVKERRALARERLSSYSRTCEPKPTGRTHETVKRTVHTHTVSPSVHSRPASGGAANFFLASALRHQQALRPPGGEDARCVQPMSATQTNYVHPHLARSQLALATFAARIPRGVLGSAR